MKYAAVYQAKLNEPPFSDAPMDALGVWVRLAAAAAILEADTLPWSETTSLRTMILMAGVARSDVEKAVSAGLCEWKPTGLFINGYDYHGQRIVEGKRKNGKGGGRPPKSAMITDDKNLPVAGTGKTDNPLPFPSLPSPSPPNQEDNMVGTKNPASGPPDPESEPEGSAAPPAYPVAFEAVWAGTGKSGGKAPAFKAWKKAGKPAWGSMAAAWSAYMLSDAPAGGYVKHLSTWLNESGHLQEWSPARGRRAAGAANGVGSFRARGDVKHPIGRIEV